MTILKCKMCGGDIKVDESMHIGTCEYCGSTMTIPKDTDDKKANLFNRANHFRRNNDFDKALNAYEAILNIDNNDAEAHWGVVLCKYGIEYVEDPKTHKRVQTCHRTQFDSILTDLDYKQAIENADYSAKKIYQEEASAIEKIQKCILEISNKEDPFDVFICYKENDKNGKRTQDSVLAQDIYYQLTREGFKVFFSKITLEDKIGTEYEPYIFAALNSAKVMLVVGTKIEYFNGVWVKNEWSRYLKLVKNGESKCLIPAYKDLDPYDLPEEFANLQAQDMSKLGFMQDLIRGIVKLIKVTNVTNIVQQKTTVIHNSTTKASPLLERAFICIGDGEFVKADGLLEQVLNSEPRNAKAYIGKLLCKLECRTEKKLSYNKFELTNYNDFNKAIRFSDDAYKKKLLQYNKIVLDGIRDERRLFLYNQAMVHVGNEAYESAIEIFSEIEDYKDSLQMIETSKNLSYEKQIRQEKAVKKWKDENERRKIKAENIKKRIVMMMKIGVPFLMAIIAFVIVLNVVLIPKHNYNKAVEYYDNKQYAEAVSCFEKAKDYNDSKVKINEVFCVAQMSNKIVVEDDFAVGLRSDGTVIAYDCEYDVSKWKNVIAIFSGASYIIGLKSDGTVVVVGDNDEATYNVSGWKDICAISVDDNHIVGLKQDGTVVAVGDNAEGACEVKEWKGIIAISVESNRTIGLKSDGTVVAVGNNAYNACGVKEWKDIIAISAGFCHTVGLKSDGTVVAVGDNDEGACEVKEWKNIIAVSTAPYHTVGLKSDGTVVAVGYDSFTACDVSAWKNITAISTDMFCTIGLKSNGTVMITGS